MKVKLFTHTDLDGVGCAIVTSHKYGKVDVEYCNYDEVDKKVNDYLDDYLSFDESLEQKIYHDLIYITDISVNEQTAERIQSIIDMDFNTKFKLLDHHPTAEWLNKYEWAEVNPLHEDQTKSSGTTMLIVYLNNPKGLYEFVEKVRRYDTWEWSTHYNDTHAKQLNDLLYLIGREKFVSRFISNPSIEFDNTEKIILEIEQEKIENYIKRKVKEIKETNILNHLVGVVFAEQYQSVLGNELAKKFDYLDFIVMINPANGTVSYRGIHDHVDLGKDIAKVFGGGGHPKAAGSQIEDKLINLFIYSLFN